MTSVISSRLITKEELCVMEKMPEACGIVIFGASGDLTHRKLLPSLFHLLKEKKLPESFYILGVGRTLLSDEDFRKKAAPAFNKEADKQRVENFLSRCHYRAGEYNAPELYSTLKAALISLDEKYKVPCRRLFYLSLPPNLYLDVVKNLEKSGLTEACGAEKSWSRVVIEKPFGHSLKSAKELNGSIKKFLDEDQIYRIDHYLGKETVQNILMFRFANAIFEPVWNRDAIDHVQITASEQMGVEHRAGYYEQAGILRDMFQNHLLQLLALIAMEPPASLEADDVRDKKVEVFKSIHVMSPAEVERNTVCGHYAAGKVDGKEVPGYIGEKGVSPDSKVPTYAAVKFELDNWRWRGVPFFIRSGKRMAERLIEITIQFKRVPTSIFKPLTPDQLSPNILKFRIQPDERILLQFEAKHPGPKLCLGTVAMDFQYEAAFKTPPPESYVRLFHDAMVGDQTLFARSDEVEQSWKVIDPILNFREGKNAPPLLPYPAGTWGPKAAETLLASYGRTWI